MANPNKLIRKLKMELGIGDYLKIRMSDVDLYNKIIVAITLPEFSRYFQNKILLPTAKLKKNTSVGNLYDLPISDELKKFMEQYSVEIKSVKAINVTLPNNSYYVDGMVAPRGTGAYMGSIFGRYSTAAAIKAYEVQSNMEASRSSLSCRFIAPYSVKFNDRYIKYDQTEFDLELTTSHADNLSTIPENIMHYFETLAKLDIKRVLWNQELKHINGIETTFSKVDLKIDDWNDAEAKREELLERFKEIKVTLNPIIAMY